MLRLFQSAIRRAALALACSLNSAALWAEEGPSVP